MSILSGTLAFSGTPALAAPPEAAPPEPSVDEPAAAPNPAIAKARALFAAGLAHYEIAQYDHAVEQWTAAHAVMADVPELEESRHVLEFDLGKAQMRAYDVDGDVTRQAAAKDLLNSFLGWLARPGHTLTDGEWHDRERARELMVQIEAAPAPEPVSVVVNVNPPPQPAPPPDRPLPDRPLPDRPSGTGLLIGGGLALGGVGASVASAAAFNARGRRAENALQGAATASERDEAGAEGRRANVGVIVSAVSALALTGAGAAMLAVGAKRRKRYISAGAALSPSMAAVSVSMRF